MAIGRLSVKVGKTGKASAHSAYISRSGEYSKYTERGEKLEATESGNMPKWAEHDPNIFWQSADAFERKNGTTYREMEIALPRELTPEQRIELVHEFIEQEIGSRHAYQFAIHVPMALDGGEQPHIHLMFSERQIDGIERDPEQYFKRYNAKYPERGGAKKGYGERAGQTLTKSERAEELKALRSRWEKMCNNHLQKAGHYEQIDMRSYIDQGKDISPEKKQLPSQWKDPIQRAKIVEYREAKADLANTDIIVTPIVRELKYVEIYGEKTNTILPKVTTDKPLNIFEQAQKVLDDFNFDVQKRATDIRLEKDNYVKNLYDQAKKIRQEAEQRISQLKEIEPQAPEKPTGFMAKTFGLGMKQYEEDVKDYTQKYNSWCNEVSTLEQETRMASDHASREERILSMGGYLTRNAKQPNNGALQDARRYLLSNPETAKRVKEAESVIKEIKRDQVKTKPRLKRRGKDIGD